MITAKQLAQQFHETYERLAPEFGYKTREASAVPWADVPEQNKKLMVAVAKAIIVPYLHDVVEPEDFNWPWGDLMAIQARISAAAAKKEPPDPEDEVEFRYLLWISEMADEHPENYDSACLCQLCRSCGD